MLNLLYGTLALVVTLSFGIHNLLPDFRRRYHKGLVHEVNSFRAKLLKEEHVPRFFDSIAYFSSLRRIELACSRVFIWIPLQLVLVLPVALNENLPATLNFFFKAAYIFLALSAPLYLVWLSSHLVKIVDFRSWIRFR